MNLNKISKLLNKGMDLFHQEKYEEALEVIDKALDMNPAYTTFGWYYRAKALRELKRFDEALICYDRIIEIAPASKESWCYKGDFLFFMEKYEEAIPCYEKAIEIDPAYTYARRKKEESRKLSGPGSEE